MNQAVTDLADEPSSLLEWVTRLAVDPQLRARLAADPRGLLGEQGFADVLPADLHHALPLVTDGVAARLGHEVDVGLVGPVEAQHVGEHPLDAVARQFTHVSDAVLAGPPAGDGDHDLDDPVDHPLAVHDDPTAFLDDLAGPDDLDAPDVDHAHHPVPDPQPVPEPEPVAATVAATVAAGPPAGAVVGNEDHGAEPSGEVPDHPEPDHPALYAVPDPDREHHADHHAEPVDVHPVHDVLDL